MGTFGNRGDAEREAIAASMETADKGERKDLIQNADELVHALSELKHLKAEQLETQDGTVDEKLETLNARVKESIEAMRDTNLEATQEMIARGYSQSAFDTVDLHEMGFTDAEKEVLTAKMGK